MLRRSLLAVVTATGLAAVLAAAPASAQIHIAAVGPMTGEYASFGQQMRQGAEQAVADINKGTYGTHIYTLGLNNGVSLLQTKYINGPTWKLIQQTRKKIISGSIKVPLTPDKKSVTALMK